ncbi:MAG: coproporphyrinogen dehydrogenase HemZ [Defluviitaleaceae bacterium]|nr:coproporphyrinogen dehydrogenase HemZ [Defluviitaleaceae bacterium]
MKFIIDNGISHNDVQTMAQVFFQLTSFDIVKKLPQHGLCITVEKNNTSILVQLYNDATPTGDVFCRSLNLHNAAAWAVYDALTAHTGYKPPWGVLTGIRPAKLISAMLTQGKTKEQAIQKMTKHYLVQNDKAELCANVAQTQKNVMLSSPNDAISVYINIPFCPTKCHYCSFAAYPMGKYANRCDGYMLALQKELEYLGKVSHNKFIENIYVGGGTPTALSLTHFKKLLNDISKNFDTKNCFEYTIEAGRPDTICDEKLMLMKQHEVNRISINPQTLNDDTLQKIGRNHSSHDFFKAYEQAQKHGFKHINIDLILGLEGEEVQDVLNTLNGIAVLDPNSVTVHCLAVKRASKLWEDGSAKTSVHTMEEMLSITADFMDKAGLKPYYLYRQKNSLGNFENVGYAKTGFEGRYNIAMMEETRSVYAAGCGAITKLVNLQSNQIERIVNVRELDQYITRIDEMIERKGAVLGWV